MSTPRSQAPSKPQWLRAELEALARRLGPNEKLPKVTELCRDYGAAPATLNLALNELERDGVIVRRHAVGIFVAPRDVKRSSHLALVCDSTFFRSANHSPFWDLLLEQLQNRTVGGEGCECHFAPEPTAQTPLQDGLMRDICSGRIGGVIGLGLQRATTEWIIAQGTPLVNLWGQGHIVVNTANDMVVRLGVQALAKRGCQRVGMWIPAAPLRPLLDREFSRNAAMEVLTSELEACGLAYDPSLIGGDLNPLGQDKAETRGFPEQGFETARAVFSAPREAWPDGIVSLDDTFTHGALIALGKLGVEVGRDVQIASHCNRDSPVLMGQDRLLLVEFDPQEIADALMEGMMSLMSLATLPPERIVFVQPRRRFAPTVFQI